MNSISKNNKKALFFSYQNLNELPGISKKIISQKHALEDLGFKVFLSHIVNNNGEIEFRIDDEVILKRESGVIGRLRWRFNKNAIFDWIKENDISFIYVRYTKFADASFTRFFRQIKRLGIKVVLEIPTYPYDEEVKAITFKDRMYKFLEKVYRKKMMRYVDRIATFSDDESIFGCQTVNIINGVDSRIFPLKKTNVPDNTVNLIGVASLNYWHGYDRIIQGLEEYYNEGDQERKVYFHVVGGDESNPEFLRLKKFVHSLELEKYVIFYGNKVGKELDDIFDNMDIGIGSLGRHRNRIYKFQSLKNIEYGMRGIPFIYSETSPLFDNESYVFKCSADDSPVQINSLVDFYDSLSIDPSEVRKNCVSKGVEWKDQFEKIFQSIEDNK